MLLLLQLYNVAYNTQFVTKLLLVGKSKFFDVLLGKIVFLYKFHNFLSFSHDSYQFPFWLKRSL